MAEVEYLTWSAFRLTSDAGVRVVVDPWVSGDADRGVPASPRGVDELADCDLVLISHAARDHLGEGLEIVRAGSATLAGWLDVRIVATDAGIDEARTVTLIPNSPFRLGDVTVIPTEAKHHSATRRPDGQWLFGKALSFFVTLGDGRCVFIGGDTAISLDLELHARLYAPTMALLGVGGIPHPGRQPIVEMSPYEAALACQMMRVDAAVPCHYVPTTTAAVDFAAQVAIVAPGTRALLLAPGASAHVPVREPAGPGA